MSTLDTSNQSTYIFSKELCALTEYSIVHLRRLWQAGKFPAPFKFSAVSRKNVWDREEIMNFIKNRQNIEV